MAHVGLNMIIDSDDPHVGGNILQGDPHSYAPSVWNYMIGRFGIRSVLDIGSGRGHVANYLHRAGLQVLAIDGLKENCKRSLYPSMHVDLTRSSVYCSVDLVNCVEVVEHIEEQYLDNLLTALSCGKVILMTNALPGQGGHHHVNEQPTKYWVQHLQSRGYLVSEDDTDRIKKLAQDDGALHLARTGLVLVSKAKQ